MQSTAKKIITLTIEQFYKLYDNSHARTERMLFFRRFQLKVQ